MHATRRIILAGGLGLATTLFLFSAEAATPQLEIDKKHQQTGGPGGVLGKPAGNVETCPDGAGRYRHYERGSIYWSSAGAFEVHGAILDLWSSLGWEQSFLGYPVTDESTTPDGVGRFNHFENGSIYWTPKTGAHEVHGEIRDRWEAEGWEQGPLGYPTTDESETPDGVGRYNHFERGSIYWTPKTGARAVRGKIRDRWAALGWEQSSLGYPIGDEKKPANGGTELRFQGGRILLLADGTTKVVHSVKLD